MIDGKSWKFVYFPVFCRPHIPPCLHKLAHNTIGNNLLEIISRLGSMYPQMVRAHFLIGFCFCVVVFFFPIQFAVQLYLSAVEWINNSCANCFSIFTRSISTQYTYFSRRKKMPRSYMKNNFPFACHIYDI